MTTSTTLPTVPVPGDKLRAGERGHIIAVNGVAATIISIHRTDKGEHVVHWAQIDGEIDQDADGFLHMPDGATVDCIRYADWLTAGGETR
ncbi:hypothetical protein ABZ912_19765 [Nonomuraea angiospora]|uniref:hypothetical protein n=1 Tax=Nonomuraea angiospora TaxID=46172 RepID=UPI00340F72AC